MRPQRRTQLDARVVTTFKSARAHRSLANRTQNNGYGDANINADGWADGSTDGCTDGGTHSCTYRWADGCSYSCAD